MVEGIDGHGRANLVTETYFVRFFELHDKGLDLMQPSLLVIHELIITLEYSRSIQRVQKEAAREEATFASLDNLILPGYIVRLHSLRSIGTLETRKSLRNFGPRFSEGSNTTNLC